MHAILGTPESGYLETHPANFKILYISVTSGRKSLYPNVVFECIMWEVFLFQSFL